MKRTLLMACVLVTLCFAGCEDSLKTDKKKLQPDTVAKLLKTLVPSTVVVEITLQYDKSETPYGGSIYSGSQYIRQERPVERAGYLVQRGKDVFVVTRDPLVHARFVKSIHVRQGSKTVVARVHSYTTTNGKMLLSLDKPLTDAKPLVFDTKAAAPYMALAAGRNNTRWSLRASSVGGLLILDNGKTPVRKLTTSGGLSLIVNAKGKLAGLNFGQTLGLSKDAWKGDPFTGNLVTTGQAQAWLDAASRQISNGVYRVTLNFRSPSKAAMQQQGGGESATEKQCFGIATSKNTVLVLNNLAPRETARLEAITIHTAKGKVKAKFACSLKDYGALVAKTAKPLKGVAKIFSGDIFSLNDQLLPSLELRIQGEKVVSYPIRNLIDDYNLGWRKQIYPDLAGEMKGEAFLFDRKGQLVAFPVSRRTKGEDSRYSYNSSDDKLTPASYLATVLGALKNKANIDVHNTPLTEEEENRLAWLGIYLQPLTEELARENNVATQTRNGRIGGIVSFVFPNSPAAKAGVEPGMILTQIHVDGEPKPHDARGTRSPFRGGVFPWAHLDAVYARYENQIPTPWLSAENSLTRYLTDTGFGRKYTADFYLDGKLVKKRFTIERMPDHYGSATRHKDKALGLTVRNLSYEARTYFRMAAKAPGVIVSMIEPGSKASVAGLKPYEIITQINDKPIADVKAFQAALKAGGELKLAVKRFTEGRVVKLQLSLPKGKKPAAPKPAAEKPVPKKPAVKKPAVKPVVKPVVKPAPKATPGQ
jgi:serine protease Do